LLVTMSLKGGFVVESTTPKQNNGVTSLTKKILSTQVTGCLFLQNPYVIKTYNMEKKLTSVDYFIEQLEAKGGAWENASIRRLQISIDVTEYLDLKRQALEMEKEQIVDAVNYGDGRGKLATYLTADEYYTQTYGK